MFPLTTFIISLLVLLGMIIYQVDTRRLQYNKKEIHARFPELRIVKKIQKFFDAIIYVVGIRIYRIIRKIQKKFRKK